MDSQNVSNQLCLYYSGLKVQRGFPRLEYSSKLSLNSRVNVRRLGDSDRWTKTNLKQKLYKVAYRSIRSPVLWGGYRDGWKEEWLVGTEHPYQKATSFSKNMNELPLQRSKRKYSQKRRHPQRPVQNGGAAEPSQLTLAARSDSSTKHLQSPKVKSSGLSKNKLDYNKRQHAELRDQLPGFTSVEKVGRNVLAAKTPMVVAAAERRRTNSVDFMTTRERWTLL